MKRKVYKAKRGLFKALALILMLAFILPTLAMAADWAVISNTLRATIEVKSAPVSGNVLVTIDGIMTGYDTIEAAMEAIPDKATASIKLNAETVPLSEKMVINGETITLNLNGKTLSQGENGAIEVQKGFLTVNNGTITRDYDGATAIRVYGSTEEADTEYTIVNINNATVIAPYAVAIFDSNKLAYGVTVNITNSTLKNGTNVGNVVHIDGDIQHDDGPTVQIEETTITAYPGNEGAGIAAMGNTQFTIKGCTISGDTAVEVKGGNVTIVDTTLKGSGNHVHKINDGGTSTQGYALAVVDNENYHDSITVTVESVTIEGGRITLLRDDEEHETVIFKIKEALATEIIDFLDHGLALAEDDDTYYKIVELDKEAINLTWDAGSGVVDDTIVATANTTKTVTVNYRINEEIAKIPKVRFVVKVEGLAEEETVMINDAETYDGTEAGLPFWFLTAAKTISEGGSIDITFKFDKDGAYKLHVFAVQVKD